MKSGADSEGIRKDDSEETRLRDGGTLCGNANTGDDRRTNSELSWRRAWVISTNDRPGNEPTGSAKKSVIVLTN